MIIDLLIDTIQKDILIIFDRMEDIEQEIVDISAEMNEGLNILRKTIERNRKQIDLLQGKEDNTE